LTGCSSKIVPRDGNTTYHGSVYKINDSEYECRFKGDWLPSADVVITITGDTILKSTITIVSEVNGVYADNLLDNMDIVNEKCEIDWTKDVSLELVANELKKADWFDYDAYDAYFEALLKKTIEYYHAYDIHINLKNGDKSWKIQPKDGGKISIWIPIKDKPSNKKMHLMHVQDDGSYEEIDFAYEKRDGKYGIRFETGHFSKFVLVTDNVTEDLGGNGNNDSLGGSSIFGERIVSTQSVQVSISDKNINIDTKQVDNKVWDAATSVLESDENAKVIISTDSSVNITAVDENGGEITSFTQPVTVTIPIGADVLKVTENKNNFTLALVTADPQGNIKLEYAGGRYDSKAECFCAYVYKVGDYVLVEDADLVQIVMTIGDKMVWHNGKGDVKLDVPPVINPATNRTELPLSYLGAALGFDVLWDGDNRVVTVVKGETSFSLKIDEEIPGYGTPYIDVKSSRTMVSASYISGMLGANVIWNPDTQEVVIVK